jgi:hypothetical protein
MPQMMFPGQEFPPPMAMPQPMQQYPVIPQGVMPVYNSIPYAPVYGNYGNCGQQSQHKCAPDISTVKIELNGLEPPKVPGYNDAPQYAPMYPGFTQMVQNAAMTSPYQPYQMQQPVQQPMPMIQQSAQPVGMQPAPAAIPQYSSVGMYPPPPQYVQQPVQTVAPPPPAIDQVPQQQAPAPVQNSTVQAAAKPDTAQQAQEAVKPLIDALNVLNPQNGAPDPTFDAQAKAVQTIAQFARVTEASDQLAQKDPNNADVKQTKEKVDTLVKPHLIKEDTFLSLADIAVKDTSKLSADDKKKADENRVISMWTLSMLQKLFKQEMNQEAKKINIPTISMNEVPGIVQVVNLVQKDPNPGIREAGIAALTNIADPNEPKDVETMRTVLGEAAEKDPADSVKAAANDALAMYPEKK